VHVTGRWFNPISGADVAVNKPVSAFGAATFHRPTGWSDAVLLSKKPQDSQAVNAAPKAPPTD